MEPTIRGHTFRLRHAAPLAAGVLLVTVWVAASVCDPGVKRLRVVVPGRLLGGAWQQPETLRRLIDRERISTVVTLTAINRDDPKYVSQSKVVDRTGVNWIIVPMRGSRATLEQMAIAADLLADPDRQPVFFHCVAGHHRTSLAHAAYLIRHAGYTGEQAWDVVAGLPWARPGAPADENDRKLILEFARVQASIALPLTPRGDRRPHMPTSRKRWLRWIARLVAAIVLAGAGYVAWDQATYNLGEVQHGRIFRSGQMPSSSLERTVRDYGIKTVLNLRGSNKDPWYVAEREATTEAGATQVDIAMSSCIWMSRPSSGR